MSYKLEKPYSNTDYANFVYEHNHKSGRLIEETQSAIFALEENEIMQNGIPIINPNFEQEQKEKQKQIRIEEIKKKLEELDLKTIRALREGGETKDGTKYIDIYQKEINTLRQELQTLKA